MYSEDVWTLIHKVLDNTEFSEEGGGSELDGFLVKVPEILDKFPESFLPDPYEKDVLKKAEFLSWFVDKMTVLHSELTLPILLGVTKPLKTRNPKLLDAILSSSVLRTLEQESKRGRNVKVLLRLLKSLDPSDLRPFLPAILDHLQNGRPDVKLHALSLIESLYTGFKWELDLGIKAELLQTLFLLLSTYLHEEQRSIFNDALYEKLSELFLRAILARENSRLFHSHILMFWTESLFNHWDTFTQMPDKGMQSVMWKLLQKTSPTMSLGSITNFFLEKEFVTVESAFVYENVLLQEMQGTSDLQSCGTWKELMGLLKRHTSSEDNELCFSTLKGVTTLCRRLEVACESVHSALSLLEEESLIEIGQILFENAVNEPSMLNSTADILLDLLPSGLNVSKSFESFHHLSLATLSLPWKLTKGMPFSELKVGSKVKKYLQGDKTMYEREEESKVKFIQLLTLLPPWLAPKWRLKLLEKIWSDSDSLFNQAVISNLHFLLLNLPKDSTKSFADEVISQTVKLGIESLFGALLDGAPKFICAYYSSSEEEIQFKKTLDGFHLLCSGCQGGEFKPPTRPGTESSSSPVPHLIKLIGYSHSSRIFKMIRPWACHIGFTLETARLWMNFFENEATLHIYPRYVRYFGSFFEPLKEQIARMRANDPDGVVVDILVSLSKLGADGVDLEYLTQELTSLYLNAESHISTFIAAQEFLRANLVKYKYIILKVGAETLDSRTLNLLTVLFKSSKSSLFLSQNMHHILPVSVLRKSRKALEFISGQAEVSLRHLLVENFQYIFPVIVFHAKGAKDYNTLIHFVETITKVSLKELLPSKRQRIMTELLLRFSSYQKKIISALGWLAENDEGGGKKKGDARKYIEPKILGVLGFMEHKLSNPNISRERKGEILQSLDELMAYMGPAYIGSVKHKILTILQSVDAASEPLVKCWRTFLTRALDSMALGSIITEALANLIPLLGSSEVLKILEELIVKRGKGEFKEHLHKLYFLPDMDELSEVNEIIARENDLANLACKDLLRVTGESLGSKNFQVQRQVLSKLKTMIRLNMNPVQGLIVSSDTTDPFITSLIFRLVGGARECGSEDLSVLYGEVLGELGAIDPGRLHDLESSSAPEKSDSGSSEDIFGQKLLNNLVQGYLRCADSGDSDSCAYSIQEVLKKFDVAPGGRTWGVFSEETREVLSPFLTSLYSRTDKRVSPSAYDLAKCTSFPEWIVEWSSYLIDQIPRDSAREIFAVCKPALRKDILLAKFLLPFIVIEVLIQSPVSGVQADRLFTETMEVVESEAPFKRDALGVIFAVLDTCNSFTRKRYELMAGKMKRNDAPDKLKAKDVEYSSVSSFVQRIPSKPMALASFECQSYSRSLMHYEHYLSTRLGLSGEELFMLQRLYGALEEPDFVVGVSRCRKSDASPEELIHMYEATGSYQDALSVYESLGSLCPGMVRCYLEMDQPNTAYALTKAGEDMTDLRLEAAWRLSKWEDIQKHSQDDPSSSSWEKDLAYLLAHAWEKDVESFNALLVASRRRVMLPICNYAAGDDFKGSYAHSYKHIVRLQMLHEAQSIADNYIFPNKSSSDANEDLLLLLRTRLEFGQYSLVHQESILQLRKTLFGMAIQTNAGPHSARLREELIWTSTMAAKVARKAGQFQKAFNLLTDASRTFGHGALQIGLEEAKLCWARGETNAGVEILKRVIEGPPEDKDKERVLLRAEAKLLLARYLDEGASLDGESVTAFYKEAREALPGVEAAFYYSAKFFYKVIEKNYQELDSKGDFVYHVIALYGRAIIYGCNSLHEALPRILSLWLDFGARLTSADPKENRLTYESMNTNLDRINKVIAKMTDKWPPYYLLTAFPQLASRMCHPHAACWTNLKKILSKVFASCPQHAFWHLAAHSKSSHGLRRQRCAEVLRGHSTTNSRFAEDARRFADGLLELCTKQLDPRSTSLKRELPAFFRLLSGKGFSQIMMPITRNMTMMLPTCAQTSKSQHNPFPSGLVYFERPDESLTVMKSLVRPKKVSFWGSNGKKYAFLCKPKDDLRRDCRLIDFNNLLNVLLKQDPESRHRDLHIRTYTVFPLDELNGVIEWVENLALFRHVLLALYEEKIGSKAILRMEDYKLYETSRTDFDRNMRNYIALKKRFSPPVFGEWFVRNFPDPQTWYASRLAYVRTTAVMSMVCYLFGLGDRHGENIMFDSRNGDTIHVDLNCLFNKGDTLAIPEVVPFRLTQNMVHAMGPLGVEGPFRIACETSLNLMRKEKDVLTSTIRPFAFDPLLDWVPRQGSKAPPAKADKGGEDVNEKAVDALKNIESRLKGYIVCRKKNNRKTTSSMPLSVSGQVDFLINEATSEDNLSQMYLGWAPYL